MMQVGRFVFGIGGESLAVAQNTYAVSWFKGKELNMVFGFQLSIARVGSTVNFLLMEPLYKNIAQWAEGHTALGYTLLIAGKSSGKIAGETQHYNKTIPASRINVYYELHLRPRSGCDGQESGETVEKRSNWHWRSGKHA